MGANGSLAEAYSVAGDRPALPIGRFACYSPALFLRLQPTLQVEASKTRFAKEGCDDDWRVGRLGCDRGRMGWTNMWVKGRGLQMRDLVIEQLTFVALTRHGLSLVG